MLTNQPQCGIPSKVFKREAIGGLEIQPTFLRSRKSFSSAARSSSKLLLASPASLFFSGSLTFEVCSLGVSHAALRCTSCRALDSSSCLHLVHPKLSPSDSPENSSAGSSSLPVVSGGGPAELAMELDGEPFSWLSLAAAGAEDLVASSSFAGPPSTTGPSANYTDNKRQIVIGRSTLNLYFHLSLQGQSFFAAMKRCLSGI